MFPEIIAHLDEEKKEAALESFSIIYPEICPGTISLPNQNGTLRAMIPPLGYDDYYSLSKIAVTKRLRGLNAFELSLLIADAANHPFKNYGTNGRVNGLDELISVGKRLQLSPKIVYPGDIIRNERMYSWTGLVYIPTKVKVMGYSGGAFVFDFNNPEFEIYIEGLVSRVEKGDSTVRFIPASDIKEGRYLGEDWSVQNEHRILSADELKEDPLTNAIFTRNGAINMSQVKRTPESRPDYKEVFAPPKGNFHLFYHLPKNLDEVYPAIVSITQNHGVVMINASNKSVGNKGFDSFSKIPLLAKGFLFCSAL